MDEMVLPHTELTPAGRRVLEKGGPLSVFFLNAAALQKIGWRRPRKVFLQLEDGEKKQLVLDRVH